MVFFVKYLKIKNYYNVAKVKQDKQQNEKKK